jgi:hypothetical protein
MNAEKNKETLIQCVDLFNKRTLEWADTYYSKDLVWEERPTPSFPQGRSGDFNAFRNNHGQMLQIFPDRSLRVLKSAAENDWVVFEQEWSGIVAIAAGNYNVSDKICMKIATFFRIKAGLIVEHIDYAVQILRQ